MEPSEQGIAEELLRIWQEILGGFRRAFKAELPDIKRIRVTKVEIDIQGERVTAPVELNDLKPRTYLLLALEIEVMENRVITYSKVYVNEESTPTVMETEVSEFEIGPDDVQNSTIKTETTDRLEEVLKGFAAQTVELLKLLLSRRSAEK